MRLWVLLKHAAYVKRLVRRTFNSHCIYVIVVRLYIFGTLCMFSIPFFAMEQTQTCGTKTAKRRWTRHENVEMKVTERSFRFCSHLVGRERLSLLLVWNGDFFSVMNVFSVIYTVGKMKFNRYLVNSYMSSVTNSGVEMVQLCEELRCHSYHQFVECQWYCSEEATWFHHFVRLGGNAPAHKALKQAIDVTVESTWCPVLDTFWMTIQLMFVTDLDTTVALGYVCCCPKKFVLSFCLEVFVGRLL